MREENRKSERVIVGCMTGTSLDGLDLARVRVLGNGLQMSWRCEGTFSLPFGDLGQRLRRIASGQPVPAAEFTSAAAQLAELHADALRDFLDGRQADLICVHGQTVFHVPPLSLQLLQPASIAHRLKTPVVFDLRAADLAAGGQGAPITPIADFVLFRSQHRRAIVNLGGFANFTLLPATTGAENAEQLLNQIDGGDICACNHVLDEIARRFLRRPYDMDGKAASQGSVQQAFYEALYEKLKQQSSSRRSLGSGDEITEWIGRFGESKGEDLARTATRAIASVIAERIAPAEEIVLAGGATRNETFVRELAAAANGRVTIADAQGIPSAFREAIAMAILGALSEDRVPITLPQITGCTRPAPVAGAWIYPPI